jgi:drug/metabolite transporter (DMT)-like permease
MNKAIDFLTLNSFIIVKVLWGASFLMLIFLNYYLLEKAPNWAFYVFILISGIFLGYCSAYYSIKHMQSTGSSRVKKEE